MKLLLVMTVVLAVQATVPTIVRVGTDPSRAEFICRRPDGMLITTAVWRRDDQLVEGSRFNLSVPGTLVITGVTTEDEAFYKCCSGGQGYGCSQGFELTVAPVVDHSLNTSHSVYVDDSLSLPCGITKGPLSTNCTVRWVAIAQRDARILLTHSFTQGSEGIENGVYSYDPTTSVLHIANFREFMDMHIKSLVIQCVLEVRGTSIVRPVNITIMYVNFVVRLPPAMVTTTRTVRFFVLVQATIGRANVTWLMDNKTVQPMAGGRFIILTTPQESDSVRSTLTVTDITDADTSSTITACATLGGAVEDQSTTHLIFVPVIQNLTMCYQDSALLLRFDLPQRFPFFRNLTRLKTFNLTLTLLFSHLTESRQNFQRSFRIDASHYRDLTMHALYINQQTQQMFRSEGIYRVQARLSIDGRDRMVFSSKCNKERNVYPPVTNCACALRGNSSSPLDEFQTGRVNPMACNTLPNDIVQILYFDLSFPGNCNSMSLQTVSSALLSGLNGILPDDCLDFVNPILRCHSEFTGTLNATLLSFTLESVVSAITSNSIQGLPYNITAVHLHIPDAITTPSVTNVHTPTSNYLTLGVSFTVAIAMVIVLTVLVVLGIVKWKRHG